MRLANPVALWLALLAVPVVVLHVLRPRRPAVQVSSTLLWQDVKRPVSAASPWQRLRPSVLLLLQLLAVVLLAAAAARPVEHTGIPLARHTVFILDTSGSMGAADGTPDRLAAAKERARSLRRLLPAGGHASIVVAAAVPRVALSASDDASEFRAALAPVRVAAGAADFAGAFALAESLETPELPVGFVLLSDGGLTDAERRLIPPGTRYERVGSRATNRGIARLVAEPRDGGLRVLATVRSTGGPPATQTLRIDVDGATVHRQQVRTPAGGVADVTAEVPDGDRVEAFLAGDDLLTADDHAFAVTRRRPHVKVLLAGPGNPFLERLLAAMAGVSVERVPASRTANGFDLAVYDRVAVPGDPGAPFLAIAPPGGVPGVRVTGIAENPAVTLVQADDALLAGLDLADVGIANAQRLQVEAHEVLVAAEGAPLLVRGTVAGRPFAYLGFALDQSNFPVQVAFPVLGDRLVAALAGASVPPADVTVGAPLPVAPPATVAAPGGREISVAAGGAVPLAERPGFWTIRRPGAGVVTVAVNADARESALAPAADLPVVPRPARPGERPRSGERSLLAWVVAALAAVLAAELFVSARARAVPRRQWRSGLGVRAAIAACLIGALLGVAVPREGGSVATIFAVDASDSMGVAGRAASVAWVQRALSRQPADARAAVLLFGGDARVEHSLQKRLQLLTPAVRVDSSRTNIAGALRLAAAMLPASSRRRVVVVSDGKPTEGDALAEARRLRRDGVRVDVRPIEPGSGRDVAVVRVEGPVRARQGESVPMRVVVSASEPASLVLTLTRDGEVVHEGVLDAPAGETVVDVEQAAGGPGLARFEARVAVVGDTVRENDTGHHAVEVEGPARVLVVDGSGGAAAPLVAALRAGALQVDVGAAVPGLEHLAAYAATVLVDVDARALSDAQIAALGGAARDLGRGLVVVGGDRSFALGGYLGSELERLLPVVSEVTDPKRRASVAEVLAIDSSGSMGSCHCRGGANGIAGGGNRGTEGGVNKTDISRAAAARTIEALHADDQVGVLAFNTEERWIVDLQKLPPADVVEKGLRGLKPAGGTDLRRPLETAGRKLRDAKARLKHIILFTDGFTAPEALDGLVEQAAGLAAEGITVSVLATGETGATDVLQRVAEAGRGRFYPGRDLHEVPQIMAQEALLASRTIVNEGSFLPKVVGAAPAVRGLTAAPPLLGYLGATAKPTAETMLAVGAEDDPLLAVWQVGLGRVAAWTSDAAARWSQHWARWDGYVAFWSAVVKDTFPPGGAGGTVHAEVRDDRLRVTVSGDAPWADGAVATARVAQPGGGVAEVGLERTSSTTFVGEIAATAAGAYGAGAVVTDGGQVRFQGTAVTQRSYSAEYRPRPADPEGLGRVSRASGGRGAISATDAFSPEGLPPGRARTPLAGWLLVAAALLWPVDVALRRLALHGAVSRAARGVPRSLPAAVRSLVSHARRSAPGMDPAVPGRSVSGDAAGPASGAGPRDGTGSGPREAPPDTPREKPAASPASDTIDRLLARKRGAGRPGEHEDRRD